MSFDEFWGMYPRRTQKIHAKKAYSKAIKVASHEDIMSGLHSSYDTVTGRIYSLYRILPPGLTVGGGMWTIN